MRELKEEDVTGALEENKHPDGRRKIKLTKRERQELVRRERAEAAAFLFLDLEQSRTYAEIAEELGISVHGLKDLTRTPEFDKAYNDLQPELGHDPRYRAARTALMDMLPNAIVELKNLLTNTRTPPTVKLKAIEKVLELNNIDAPSVHNERQEIVQFLIDNRIDARQFGFTVPVEYMEAYQASLEVVDVEPVNVYQLEDAES